MKPFNLIAVVCLTAPQMLFAQEPVYTEPAGYVNHTLLQGFNVLGLTMQNPPVASGTLDAVSGTALTDNQLSFTPLAGRTYILEIDEAATTSLVGTIQEIPAASISGTTITTPQNLGNLGLAIGDSYTLRVAPTLEEIFTTVPLSGGGVLVAAVSSGNADIIWVPDGTGGYNRYYLRSGTTPAFRNVATNLASPNVPLIYADGFLLEKKTTASASLVVTGNIKTKKTNSVAIQGFNILSAVSPVGLNLFNAGLESNLTAAVNDTNADIVWVQQPNLTYIKYFRRSGTGAGWRVVGTTTTLTQAQAEAVSLSSGFLIERKSPSSTNISLNVPAGYSQY